jgi:pimeloyl-ACP methyl ester carboxylesterase
MLPARFARFQLVQQGASTFRAARLAPAVLLATFASAALAAPRAMAAIAWAPCANTNELACGRLAVPLDHSGGGGEVITLAMRRHLAPVGGAREAVIALAGGPGQAAIPFTAEFAALLGPILSTRDLIVFDQRGIGSSHPLACAAFEHLDREPSPQAVATCAQQIGPSRGFYETADTVADIEAIRLAGGYEKLVLYGTSYGTKVAERYAQRHPDRVAALVLDSVVGPNGPDPLHRSTFAAIPRVLRSVCAAHACARISSDPVGELSRLVRTMHRHPVHARAFDEHGHAHAVQASAVDLLAVLLGGDVNPLLRAEFPAAVRSALQGDGAALARMVRRAEGEREPERESLEEGFDAPLYFATTCEEQDFPFNRSSSPSTRRAEALAYARALPRATFAPFSVADALSVSDIDVCAAWPFATQNPEVDEAPLPAVPTLIFSGEEDIRTPTSEARALAAQIPGAQLLVVPRTGHSALSAALGDCPRNALLAFFAGRPVRPCDAHHSPPALAPMPVAPRRLRQVTPVTGDEGTSGRALHAVLLTLQDFYRETAVELIAKLGVGKLLFGLLEVKLGGLRGGWAELGEGTIRLHRYSYVPGVTVSGSISPSRATLRIGGFAGVHGTLHLVRGRMLGGILGGRRVSSRRPVPLL